MLTPQQNATLAADIAADPVLSVLPRSNDNSLVIAAAYNQQASPAYIVWRTNVSWDEITQGNFDWVQVDNLSVGKARIMDWMFGNDAASINPSKPNIRSGIAECWKGTSALLAVQTVILTICKRNATRFEKLFSTGSGSDASPSTMAVEGQLTGDMVQAALGW